jgi:hypothetical protein
VFGLQNLSGHSASEFEAIPELSLSKGCSLILNFSAMKAGDLQFPRRSLAQLRAFFETGRRVSQTKKGSVE